MATTLHARHYAVSVAGLVGPASVCRDWVMQQARSATFLSVWQHVKLSEQTGLWETVTCCWDIQPRKKGSILAVLQIVCYHKLNLCRASWVHKHPHLWFLPCNSGNFQNTRPKFHDFVDKVAFYMSTEKWPGFNCKHTSHRLYIQKTPWVPVGPRERFVRSSAQWVSLDPRRTAKLLSFINT